MKIRRSATASLAVATALALGLSACGGDTGGDAGDFKANAGNTSIVNPSDKEGGTLRFAHSDVPDSLDPGDTYYANMWNFSRLYARTLMTFTAKPGAEGLALQPDLAAGPGQPSNDNKTWTYKLKPGLVYEDGTPITSKDVKYAVARSNFDKGVLPNGPSYFADFTGSKYKGPYKDKNLDNLKEIETPDDLTIVFNLTKPFAEMDYLATSPQTAPVPQAKDTGAKYKERVLSSGPYKFESNEIDKRLTLVRNDKWDKSTDPLRHQKPEKIVVDMKIEQDEIDRRLQSGAVEVDMAGTGMADQGRAAVLSDEAKKGHTDNAFAGFHWFTWINSKVKPLDNVECRRAVIYANDQVAYQNAYGGAVAGGEFAHSVLPPSIKGYTEYDMYPNPGNKGNVEKAKEALKACGEPDGFELNVAYRSDRPKEKKVVEGIQQAMAKVGIKVNAKGYPAGKYTNTFAGSPDYVAKEKLGLAVYGWAADWPSGFGFLSQILDGRAIKDAGNSNIAELDDPEINKWLDEAMASTDEAKRTQLYTQIDKKAMEQAAIMPGVYARSLLYRPSKLANVYVTDAYGMYDYTQLSLSE